ncbi:capsule biosynthesis GfcC family protein [Pseudomonas schmalbachii]|uniref:Capsule biosynthesis GfcC family protein n=1 Tax=Pseudomonas schmalbachii TaxID=2816993 RepID=A0ABS3TU20_9PSED|nr:capsule biosynthesis GfcC family protein [Pseudomonas schmalbachii]MBO3277165.1 capsule biosynthesis GfcC family protein [Pseudomonas schmalbachii]
MNCRNLLMALAAALLCHAASASDQVEVRGDAKRPGLQTITPDTRLSTVFNAAQVNPESYWLGAAWLHQSLLKQQGRLKAGILFDLQLLKRKALLDDQPALAELLGRLHQQITDLPVTGRLPHLLDPVGVEVDSEQNALVGAGDVFIFSPRPNHVRVVGAVQADCTLAHIPLQAARLYLQQCAQRAEADGDWLYLIQPDGNVSRLGIALWNRQDSAPPAPGSTILVPIKAAGPDSPAPDLNQELAEFLATQPLSEVAQ